MGLLTRMRKQKAVYWSPAGVDNYGERTYAEGIELMVRWENTAVEFTDQDGRRSLSRAIVFVGQDVVPGGVLWLGPLAGLSGDRTKPPLNSGAEPIRQFEKMPNLRVTEYLRRAYL